MHWVMDSEIHQTQNPLRFSAKKLRVLCGKSIRQEATTSTRHLDFVTGVNPRLGAPGNVQKVGKTGLLHHAGGGARPKAAGADDRDRVSRLQIQLREPL